MTYNFDTIINRQGTNSIKFDFDKERGKPADILPMWVADMDFPAPPEVLEDIQRAVSHGIFGYTEPKEEYYNAVTNWFGSHFGYYVPKRETVIAPGIVFALAQAVRAFTEPGEAVMIQTPVYYPFFEIIRDNGRTLVGNPLVYDEGKYFIDFEDFEAKIAGNNVKLFILCSPHNPVGRVWTQAELERMNEICIKHDVIIISDEIHCDFVWPGHTHTCFGLLNENTVIATAPSKTFNLAGLQVSNIFIKNADLRRKLKAEINRSGYSQLNTLGLVACQSAYTKGEVWLEKLKKYLIENIRFARKFATKKLRKIKLVEPESTYLLWFDFSEYGLLQEELDRRITQGAKLWLSSGTIFGAEGRGFQRMNIACPKATLMNAFDRLLAEFSQ
ncbi:MAG: pyridoxal phosphate-dependent aminotransferase [Planctomycetaceae bacterium]|nr:pyridoxal phosphate-dependent aminotransferase [Planctomycetaceae bacterium]